MKYPIRSAMPALACLLLTACITNYEFPRTYESERLAAGNRFAAVSIVSSELTCARIPTLAFNNEIRTGTAGFDVSATIKTAFAEVFEEVSNGTRVLAQADAGRLAAIYTPGNVFYPIDYRNVRDYVAELMQFEDLDYLALYVGSNDPDFIGDTRHRLDDIGCYTRGDSDPLYRYIAAEMLLFHKDEDRPIAQAFIREYEETGLEGSMIERFLTNSEQQKATETFVAQAIDTSARLLFK